MFSAAETFGHQAVQFPDGFEVVLLGESVHGGFVTEGGPVDCAFGGEGLEELHFRAWVREEGRSAEEGQGGGQSVAAPVGHPGGDGPVCRRGAGDRLEEFAGFREEGLGQGSGSQFVAAVSDGDGGAGAVSVGKEEAVQAGDDPREGGSVHGVAAAVPGLSGAFDGQDAVRLEVFLEGGEGPFRFTLSGGKDPEEDRGGEELHAGSEIGCGGLVADEADGLSQGRQGPGEDQGAGESVGFGGSRFRDVEAGEDQDAAAGLEGFRGLGQVAPGGGSGEFPFSGVLADQFGDVGEIVGGLVCHGPSPFPAGSPSRFVALSLIIAWREGFTGPGRGLCGRMEIMSLEGDEEMAGRTEMRGLKGRLPGVLAAFLIAAPAWVLGKAFPLVGGPVFAILAGMAAATALPGLGERPIGSFALGEGIRYTSKKLLQVSIVLLGFEMNLYNILRVGGQSLLVMAFTLGAAFVTAYVLGKLLKIPGNTVTLIGVGTSICGGSAIAAVSPVIGARDEEVSQSISTIFLFNILAVFLFPVLGHWMNMGDLSFGMWAGTAVNDTSSVVAAGTAWSEAAGNNAALQFATIVKLTRTLMIVPIALVLAVYASRKAGKDGRQDFSFVRVFPWFVLAFAGAAVLNTFAGIPAAVSGGLVTVGKFMIVMAMAAIGLNTDLKRLLSNGVRPILLGLGTWGAVAGVSLVVQRFLGI